MTQPTTTSVTPAPDSEPQPGRGGIPATALVLSVASLLTATSFGLISFMLAVTALVVAVRSILRRIRLWGLGVAAIFVAVLAIIVAFVAPWLGYKLLIGFMGTQAYPGMDFWTFFLLSWLRPFTSLVA